MKKILTIIILSIITNSYSTCLFYAPEHKFYYEGYDIQFNFEKTFTSKNFKEVFNLDEADFILNLDGKTEQKGSFEWASAFFELKDKSDNIVMNSSAEKRCLTQNCSVSDMGNTFIKALKSFEKKLGCPKN